MTNKNVHISTLITMILASASVLAEVPIAITAIEADDIEAVNYDEERIIVTGSRIDRSDFIGRSPIVTDVENLDTGRVILRGLDNPNRSRVLVNGVQSEFQLVSPGSGIDLNRIPAALIDRVEIVTGPTSAVYGSEAAGGVVNFDLRNDFGGFKLGGSYALYGLQSLLGDYRFTVESKNQCDASHGSPLPGWALQNKWNFGLPDFNVRGDFMTWGDIEDGYKQGTVAPQSPPRDYKFKIPELVLDMTFDQAEKLIERINALDSVPAQDKRDYILNLNMSIVFGGEGRLSDWAYVFGQFNPDQVFEDFKQWSANRSEEDRQRSEADFQAFSRSVGSSDFAGAGGDESPDSGATATTQDAETTQPTKDPRNPFDMGFTYPAEYMFDLTLCKTKKQRDDFDKYMTAREAARLNWAVHFDYMRGYPYTARTERERIQDEKICADSLVARDNANNSLRALWKQCLNGDTGTAQITPGSADSSVSQSTEAPAAGEQPAISSSTDSGVSVDAERFGISLGYKFSENFSAELHAYQYVGGADGEKTRVPATGLGFAIHPENYSLSFGVPFSEYANRDQNAGLDARAIRTYTNDSGIGRLDNFLQDGPIGGFTRPGTVTRRFRNDNWQIFWDLDVNRSRLGPTVGYHYEHVPKHQVFQEFGGYGPQGNANGAQTQDPWLQTTDLLKGYTTRRLSFNNNYYNIYTVPEIVGFDFNTLNGVANQTFWGNDKCGDAALPAEGVDYLSPGSSAIDSVDDQWALEHVGLDGDEPKLDEFATPIVVGIIDTGIDWNHLDFSWDNLWRNEAEIPDNGIDDDGNGYIDDLIGWNFTGQNNTPWDYDGHGTFVAGIIAATQGNDAGIDGINGSAKIMVLKALNSFGRTRGSYIAEAIAYGADNGAHVLNLSVTGPGFPKIVQDAVDYARSKGVLVIVAAGNRGEEIASAEPAPLRGVLTVAATDRDDKRAPFSNVGLAVGVAAPGIDVVSLRARATDFMFNSADTPYQRQDAFLGDDARYYRSTGTSFSTPIVTGIASLVLATNPELTPAQLTRILKQSARDVEVPGIDRFTGYGVVDARAALAADPEFFIHAMLPFMRQVSVEDRGYLQVVGHADADQFAAARLELGQGEDPQTWITVGDPMTEPVRAAELARIPAEQLAEASTWTIRLTVEHQNGRTREMRYVIDVSE